MPAPWRSAFSTRLPTTWSILSGSAQTSGRPAATSITKRSSGSPCATCPATARRTAAGRSTTCLRTSSRPASIRLTSSRSVSSRVTRSASAFTVSSMIFFWASGKRSQRASSVAVNPLTLVSGDRSSWATVLTRSARLRSVRSRARSSRSTTSSRSRRRPSPRTNDAVTSRPLPLGSTSRRSGWRVRVISPPYGSVQDHQSRPCSSDERQHVAVVVAQPRRAGGPAAGPPPG